MYIQLRNNIYHFRLKVPSKYRKRIGKREIRQSLNTRGKHEAQRQAIVLAEKYMAEFEQYSSNGISPRNQPKLSNWCYGVQKRRHFPVFFAEGHAFPDTLRVQTNIKRFIKI